MVTFVQRGGIGEDLDHGALWRRVTQCEDPARSRNSKAASMIQAEWAWTKIRAHEVRGNGDHSPRAVRIKWSDMYIVPCSSIQLPNGIVTLPATQAPNFSETLIPSFPLAPLPITCEVLWLYFCLLSFSFSLPVIQLVASPLSNHNSLLTIASSASLSLSTPPLTHFLSTPRCNIELPLSCS